MKTTEHDVRYCGVDEEKIKSASPVLNEEVLRYHHLYLTERHKIYKRKEIEKLPQSEWTQDEVFKKFRFTNVRRELDKESVWLIDNISKNNELSLEEKIYWSMLFRTYNKSETFRILGFPHDFKILEIMKHFDEIRSRIDKYTKEHPKYVWYTNVFNCGGIKATWAMPSIKGMYECTSSEAIVTVVCETKDEESIRDMTWREAKNYIKDHENCKIIGVEENMPMRMIHLIKYAVENDYATKIIDANSQKEVFEIITEIDGFSDFLGYQIFVDLTYIPEFKFSENEFVVSGPGCSTGISYLFEDKDGMTDEECLFWVRDNIEKEWAKRGLEYNPEELFDHLPEYDRTPNIMMFENSFCELGKTTKAKRGIGRPRNNYKPSDTVESTNKLF